MQFYAKDIMSTELVTAVPEMTCQEVEKVLAESKVSGVPVVNSKGNLIGIISMYDIIKSGKHVPIEEHHYYQETMYLDEILREAGLGEMTVADGFVSDFMTEDVIVADQETPIEQIAKIMYQKKIHRIIIVEQDSNKPVGIVTTFDMLKVLAEMSSTEELMA